VELGSFIGVPEEERSFFQNVVYLVVWDNGKSPEGRL
jgi:hypothetical protein